MDKRRRKYRDGIKRAKAQHKAQEEFIRLLESLSVKEALARICKPHSWLNDLRARDDVFSQRVAILDSIQRGLDIGQGLAPLVTPDTEHATSRGQTPRQALRSRQDLVNLQQKEAFLQIYKETKRRSVAAERLNLSTLEVLQAMNIDAEFTRDIENIRLAALWDAEDAMLERAAESGVDARFLMNKMQEAQKKVPKRNSKKEASIPSWAKTGS